MLKGLWSSSGIRPAYVVAMCIFLVAATGVLLRVGVLSEGPLAWAAASRSTSDSWGGPGTTSGSPHGHLLSLLQSTLDAARALQDSQTRIQAELEDIDSKIAIAGGSGSGGSSGNAAWNGLTAESRAWQEYPSSDVSKLLPLYPVGSAPYKELQAMRYCREDGEDSSRPPDSGLLTWTPAAGRYLLPICDYGLISNRLNCFRSYMLLATLLNRTLVIPERDGVMGYQYGLVMDAEHARRCIGGSGAWANRTVVTFREYLEMEGLWKGGRQVKDAVLDSIWCWKDKCDLDKARGMFPKGVALPAEFSGWEYRKKVGSVPDLHREFGALHDPLISFGDLYNINHFKDVAKEIYSSPNLPFAGLSCKLVIQPHVAVILAAKGLVKTVFGPQYMAVHIRRGDFYHFWANDCQKEAGPGGQGTFSVTSGCKLPSIGAIANCILEKLEGTNINMVFVATNAYPTELTLLEKLLASNPRGGNPVTLLRRPEQLAMGPPESYYWAGAWNGMKLDGEAVAHTALDKLLCAMAKIFMGSRGSTFTDDIVGMRAALGTQTCQDHHLCAAYAVRSQDQLPTFNVTFTDPYQGTRNYRRRRK